MVTMTCRFATQISGLRNVKLQSRHRCVAEMTCPSHLQADLFLLRVPTFIDKRYWKGKAVPVLGYICCRSTALLTFKHSTRRSAHF
jgi:hypothetical protein